MPLDRVHQSGREARCEAILLALCRKRSWKALPGEGLASQSLCKKLLTFTGIKYLFLSVKYRLSSLLGLLAKREHSSLIAGY
ncbi:MAG: hypothetical protein ACM37W_23510 [Actinomycetota bacterium]